MSAILLFSLRKSVKIINSSVNITKTKHYRSFLDYRDFKIEIVCKLFISTQQRWAIALLFTLSR